MYMTLHFLTDVGGRVPPTRNLQRGHSSSRPVNTLGGGKKKKKKTSSLKDFEFEV